MSPWLLFSRINGYTRETGRRILRGPRALRGAGGSGYKEDSEHQKESIPYEQPRHYEDSGLQEDPGT